MAQYQYDPDRIFHALEEAAEEWANAQLQADQLEKMGEILLANLQFQAKEQGVAIGLCKEWARCQPEWETHVKGEIVARNKADRARARYRNMQALSDARRTEQATTRALSR